MDSLTPSFSTQWAAKKSRMVQTKKKPQSSSRTWKKNKTKLGHLLIAFLSCFSLSCVEGSSVVVICGRKFCISSDPCLMCWADRQLRLVGQRLVMFRDLWKYFVGRWKQKGKY